MKVNKIVHEKLANQGQESCLKKNDLRRIAKHLPIMAWIAEPDAPANWFNPEWLAFANRTEETMKNWAYQDFHHPDYIENVIAGRYKATLAGKVWEDTFPLLGGDNKFHWLLSRAVPILDADGNVDCYFGFHLDLTAKMKLPPLTPQKQDS